MAGKKCAALLDSGPLAALLDLGEASYPWCAHQLHRLNGPLLTCEAVISESLYLLRHSNKAVSQIQAWRRRGVLNCWTGFDSSADEVFSLMIRYESVPMSFADDCLVRMSELWPEAPVFTLDSDFRICRRSKRQAEIASRAPQAPPVRRSRVAPLP